MFCKQCGATIKDDSQFCPSCGAQVVPLGTGAPVAGATPQQTQQPQYGHPQQGVQYGQPGQPYQTQPNGFVSSGNINQVQARDYLIRGVVGASAIISAIIAVVFLVKLVGNIEGVINLFSGLDSLATGLGIAGFIVCGLALLGLAVFSALPLGRFVLEDGARTYASIDRGMVFSIVTLVLCLAVWICKLIFHSSIGGDVNVVLYSIFSIYGGVSGGCVIAIAISLVLLYIVRMKLMPQNSQNTANKPF